MKKVLVVLGVVVVVAVAVALAVAVSGACAYYVLHYVQLPFEQNMLKVIGGM